MSDFRIIVKCRACHASSDFFESILEMDEMPLAGSFCAHREEALRAPKFPLNWLLCRRCGLLQVAEELSEQRLFASYHYASSSVSGLVKHFKSYARFFENRYGMDSKLAFLEIGCNDGVLLKELPKAWRKLGVDPSDVALRAVKKKNENSKKDQIDPLYQNNEIKQAQNDREDPIVQNAPFDQNDYSLIPAPFTLELAIAQHWEGTWDLVSGSNCLAHISDLKDVFCAAHFALKMGGWFWIEVHDLGALLEGCQWDTIYHEHKAEWSEQALQTCVEALGFELRFVMRVPLHGGVLRCGFEKCSKADSIIEKKPLILTSLSKLVKAYQERRSAKAVQELLAAKRRGAAMAAYGASGRANVYLNQIPELNMDFVVDEAPLRVHRFIPSIATPIVPRSELLAHQPHYCLLTAWNYRQAIVAKNQAYQGKWLCAFPAK